MRTVISGITAGIAVLAVLVFGLPVQPVSAGIPGGGSVACDFVTGGGWILGAGGHSRTYEYSSLAEGVRANFAVGGGVKHGAFWGHLEYVDHSTSPPMNVHGTDVTNYTAPVGILFPTRVIEGEAELDGAAGFTYRVEVTDHDEPGRDIDRFSIQVFYGAMLVYQAGANYGDGPIRGGNIQLHKGNRSNTPPLPLRCAE